MGSIDDVLYSCIEFDDENDDQKPFEVPGGKIDTGLGIAEYSQYKQQVEAKRRLVKSEYAHVKRKVASIREHLLDRYDKLWNLVEKRKDRDDERRKQMTDPMDLKSAREKEAEYRLKLLAEIKKYEDEQSLLDAELNIKHQYLATFLSENGNMLSSVEKAEALDTALRRKEMRKQAHDQILDAIQGSVSIDIDTDHMSFRERQDLKNKEAASRATFHDLRIELQELRSAEEVTDDLVDRLKNKVESIDLLEESQVEMIDSQLIKQRKLGLKLKELKSQVERNNSDLEAVADKVKMDITKELDGIISPKLTAGLCCGVCVIFVCIFVICIYYIIDKWPS